MFESEGRLIQRRNLRVSFAENERNHHDNYDPWRDIYLRGNFDRQQVSKKMLFKIMIQSNLS